VGGQRREVGGDAWGATVYFWGGLEILGWFC